MHLVVYIPEKNQKYIQPAHYRVTLPGGGYLKARFSKAEADEVCDLLNQYLLEIPEEEEHVHN